MIIQVRCGAVQCSEVQQAWEGATFFFLVGGAGLTGFLELESSTMNGEGQLKTIGREASCTGSRSGSGSRSRSRRREDNDNKEELEVELKE